MTSNNENEDESAEPMSRPVETDQEGGPAQQIDLALPLNEAAPDPMDEDKPVPVPDEIPASRTEEEDEPVPVRDQVTSSQTEAAPDDAGHEDRIRPEQGEVPPVETEASLHDANYLDKPVPAQHEVPSSVTNAPLNNASHEDEPIHPQTTVSSSQIEVPFQEDSHENKLIHPQATVSSSQIEVPFQEDSHKNKPIHPENTVPSSQIEAPSQEDSHENKPIHAQDTVPSSQIEAPFHDGSLKDFLHPAKDNVPSIQTEAPLNDASQVEKSSPQRPHQDSAPPPSLDVGKNLLKPEVQVDVNGGPEGNEVLNCKREAYIGDGTAISSTHCDTAKLTIDAKAEPSELPEIKSGHDVPTGPKQQSESATPIPLTSNMKSEVGSEGELSNGKKKTEMLTPQSNGNSSSKRSFLLEDSQDGSESGTEEEQLAFMKELHNFFRERSMEFKPPKFYGEGLNCLKLWRSVMRLGGYDKVTAFKLWRQVGESFKPPKTCTTVSWTFRGFYEKALLDYERHKTGSGELSTPIASNSEPMNVDNQASGSGRARRDAAARAMQGWHSERLLDNGEVSYPIIKDKNSISLQKREKQLKNLGLLKRKKPSYDEDTVKAARTKPAGPQVDVEVVDIGPPADWVKINVQRTKDSYEVYALVPGLLREEVRVQSDPAGRLVISGEPEHPDNPWGVTAFKKVVSLPSRIDPHQTSAVVTLHGQLLVRVPFERAA